MSSTQQDPMVIATVIQSLLWERNPLRLAAEESVNNVKALLRLRKNMKRQKEVLKNMEAKYDQMESMMMISENQQNGQRFNKLR